MDEPLQHLLGWFSLAVSHAHAGRSEPPDSHQGPEALRAYEDGQAAYRHAKYVLRHVLEDCPACDGRGWTKQVTEGRTPEGMKYGYLLNCDACAGSGKRNFRLATANAEGVKEIGRLLKLLPGGEDARLPHDPAGNG
jgi:hypothetical protein